MVLAWDLESFLIMVIWPCGSAMGAQESPCGAVFVADLLLCTVNTQSQNHRSDRHTATIAREVQVLGVGF